jgi:MoxR-like ATPase
MPPEDIDQPLSITDSEEVADTILTEISSAVVASERFLETVLTGILANQHVLIEDVPGTGKTLTARSLADILGLEFSRIQFTPDLLPSDITGSTVFKEGPGEFEFNQGPIFSNVVLADEINRAPPKTQAALLEVMEEKQVTVGDTTRPMPTPFFVLATQNPIEQEGTFELPESQRDRFIIKTSIGYPDRSREQELLSRRVERQTSAPTVEQAVSPETFEMVQQVSEYIHVEPKVRDYILDIGRTTRTNDGVEVGVSPRGTQRLLEATRARAVIRGREFVVPDDVKQLAVPVFAHRIVLNSESMIGGETRENIIQAALEEVAVPSMDTNEMWSNLS